MTVANPAVTYSISTGESTAPSPQQCMQKMAQKEKTGLRKIKTKMPTERVPNDIKNITQGFGGYFQVTWLTLYNLYSSQSGKVWGLNGALPTGTFTGITVCNSNTKYTSTHRTS